MDWVAARRTKSGGSTPLQIQLRTPQDREYVAMVSARDQVHVKLAHGVRWWLTAYQVRPRWRMNSTVSSAALVARATSLSNAASIGHPSSISRAT